MSHQSVVHVLAPKAAAHDPPQAPFDDDTTDSHDYDRHEHTTPTPDTDSHRQTDRLENLIDEWNAAFAPDDS